MLPVINDFTKYRHSKWVQRGGFFGHSTNTYSKPVSFKAFNNWHFAVGKSKFYISIWSWIFSNFLLNRWIFPSAWMLIITAAQFWGQAWLVKFNIRGITCFLWRVYYGNPFSLGGKILGNENVKIHLVFFSQWLIDVNVTCHWSRKRKKDSDVTIPGKFSALERRDISLCLIFLLFMSYWKFLVIWMGIGVDSSNNFH